MNPNNRTIYSLFWFNPVFSNILLYQLTIYVLYSLWKVTIIKLQLNNTYMKNSSIHNSKLLATNWTTCNFVIAIFPRQVMPCWVHATALSLSIQWYSYLPLCCSGGIECLSHKTVNIIQYVLQNIKFDHMQLIPKLFTTSV